ncbi:MAG: fasciclin domain-containing protein [Candidatus Gracilibacteria bacterium]|nr:fasciclin domain-containing protein [Candidatus Gracilibacteria bacterium]
MVSSVLFSLLTLFFLLAGVFSTSTVLAQEPQDARGETPGVMVAQSSYFETQDQYFNNRYQFNNRYRYEGNLFTEDDLNFRYDEVPSSFGPSLEEAIRFEPPLERFATWLQATNLDFLLYTAEGATVFVPTNEAFDRMEDKLQDYQSGNVVRMQAFLLNHIVPRKMMFEEIPFGNTVFSTLANTNIRMDKSGRNRLSIGDADLVAKNLHVGNAYFHLIDSVIMPPRFSLYRGSDVNFGDIQRVLSYQRMGRSSTSLKSFYVEPLKNTIDVDFTNKTVAQVLIDSGMATKFTEWLKDTGWLQYLRDAEDVTIFVPVDEYFDNMDPRAMSRVEKSPELMSRIIQAHILPQEMYKRDFREAWARDKNLDGFLQIKTAAGSDRFLSKTSLLSTDIQANNGVLHFVSEFVRNEGNLGDVIELDVYDTQVVTDRDGKIVFPMNRQWEWTQDNFERNLLPNISRERERYKNESVVSILEQSPAMDRFEEALVVAGLKDDLAGIQTDVTLFVPSNEAFEALGEVRFRELLDNREALRAVLRNHIVMGRFDTNRLRTENVTQLQNFRGGKVSVEAGNTTRIENGAVLAPDISGINGVIHVIDRVID